LGVGGGCLLTMEAEARPICLWFSGWGGCWQTRGESWGVCARGGALGRVCMGGTSRGNASMGWYYLCWARG